MMRMSDMNENGKESAILYVDTERIPSVDPIAYAAGFRRGFFDLTPFLDQADPSPEYQTGLKHGVAVREEKEPQPIWMKVSG